MKKYIVFILISFFIFIETICAEDFSIKGKNVILYNLNDNEVIYSKNEDEKVSVASLTKIMTTIVAIENIEDLNKEVIIKYNDFYKTEGYSKAGLKPGDKLTYEELLYGIMLPSGADAVNAVVNNSLGYESFINKMNDTAKKIGLYNTYFSNPIGKDDELNYSTASDIAKLLKYALKNEIFNRVFKTRTYVTTNGIYFKSSLSHYDSALDTSKILGAKTGYTPNAGRCLASISNLNNVNYLLVVINSGNNSTIEAVKDSLIIYDYYSKNYGYKDILTKDTIIKKIPVKFSKQKYYNIRANKNIKMYIKNDSNISYKYSGINKIGYKSKKGMYLGNIKVYNNGVLINTSKVFLEENITYYNIFIWCLLFVLLIIMLLLILIAKNRKKVYY